MTSQGTLLRRVGPRLSMRRKIVFGLVTTVAFFGFFEVLVRIIDPSTEMPRAETLEWVGADFAGRFPNQADPFLFWALTPKAKIPDLEEHLNARGFRGPDFAIPKPKGTRRALLLGDSNAFGIGVEGHATFAHRLGRWLDSDPETPWEVINTGVPGYSSFQMLRYFERFGRELAPDVVVVYAGAWNDFTPAVGLGDRAMAERMASSFDAVGQSRLLKWLRAKLSRASVEREASRRQEYAQRWSDHQERPDGPRVSLSEFRQNLKRIADLAAAGGAKTVFIVPPAPKATKDRFRDSEVYAQEVRDLCASNQGLYPCLDVRNEFSELSEEKLRLFAPNDIIHPGVDGHWIIAQRLAVKMSELGVEGLPPRAEVPVTRLRDLADRATYEVGDPPVAGGTTQLHLDEHQVTVVVPSRLGFRDVAIPRAAALLFFISYAVPKDSPLGEEGVRATFVISASEASGPAREIFREEISPDRRPWVTVRRRRVDLAEFSERRLTLAFEITGAAAFGTWGDPTVEPFR